MIAIDVRFPGHGYHATPWGRHVNEGVTEWPPSPYRLLRALYDTWKRKRPEWEPDRVEMVLAALASELPSFELPRAVASHTRSYLHSNKEDPMQKSLVFDGFIIMDRCAALRIFWPTLALAPDVLRDLSELLDLMNYLGRSESWVEAKLSDLTHPTGAICAPLGEAEADGEIVQVACAVPANRFTPPLAPKVRTWMDALAYSTTDLVKDRLSDPPALERISYIRPYGCLDDPPIRGVIRDSRKINAVRFALDGKVLPLVTLTVDIAEQVRSRLMGSHKARMNGDASLVSSRFSGKDADGSPLKDHSHCFIFPMDTDRDGRIDEIFVYCRDGFDTMERMALDGLRELWQTDGKPKVRCVVVQEGLTETMRKRSRTFRSTTPFIPTRYYRNGRGDFGEWLSEEIRRECANHGLPEPKITRRVDESPTGSFWVEFRRNRKGETPRAGYGLEMEFPIEVSGPFSIGYGCHFGLGQFEVV